MVFFLCFHRIDAIALRMTQRRSTRNNNNKAKQTKHSVQEVPWWRSNRPHVRMLCLPSSQSFFPLSLPFSQTPFLSLLLPLSLPSSPAFCPSFSVSLCLFCWLAVFLSLCRFVFVFVCLSPSASLSLCLRFSLCLFVFVCVCLSLSVSLYLCLSLHLSLFLSLSLRLSLSLSLSLFKFSVSLSLFVCLSLCLSVSRWLLLFPHSHVVAIVSSGTAEDGNPSGTAVGGRNVGLNVRSNHKHTVC